MYGRTGRLKWAQENPNELGLLQEGRPASLFRAGHPFNCRGARAAAKLPPGHPEGFIDGDGQHLPRCCQAINGQPYDAGRLFPDLDAGVRGMRFVEAVLSLGKANWVNVWRRARSDHHDSARVN